MEKEKARERYFTEVSGRLSREGFQVEHDEASHLLNVSWSGQPLCHVTEEGGVRYWPKDVEAPEANDAMHRVTDLARTVCEYMQLMETAPPLKASGLSDGYFVLADFNTSVLAGHPTSQGVEFVTWDWDYDRRGVTLGHYFGGEYENAKRDFAVRAGLVPKQALFTEEQLTGLYRCIDITRSKDDSVTFDEEQRLGELQRQIKDLLPDVEQRIAAREQALKALEGMTVRDFLTQHPGEAVSLMAPFGFCYLTPEMAAGALAGEEVMANPGCAGDNMALESEVLLDQVILGAQYHHKAWCFLTDFPSLELKAEQGDGTQADGMGMQPTM